MKPKKIIEKMSDEDLAVLSSSLPSEFERRGLAITSAVSVLRPKEADEHEAEQFAVRFDLKSEYAHAVHALTDLGISSCDGQAVPTMDAIAQNISSEITEWLNERAQAGVHDELVIAPSLGELSLEQLVRRFDRKQSTSTYVWDEFWNKYETGELNNEAKGWQVAIVLNDTRDPRDHREAVNEFSEPGLAYTGLSLGDQQKALRREVKSMAKRGYSLSSLAITQLITLNARRRALDEPQLDERTFTRLIQHDTVEVAGFDWVPAVSWLRGRMRLFGSDASLGWGRFGVRRALTIKLNPAVHR